MSDKLQWDPTIHDSLTAFHDTAQLNATNDALPTTIMFAVDGNRSVELRRIMGAGGRMTTEDYNYYETQAGNNVFHVRFEGGDFGHFGGFDFVLVFQFDGKGTIVGQPNWFSRGSPPEPAVTNKIFNELTRLLAGMGVKPT